jgi:hypothetical protein
MGGAAWQHRARTSQHARVRDAGCTPPWPGRRRATAAARIDVFFGLHASSSSLLLFGHFLRSLVEQQHVRAPISVFIAVLCVAAQRAAFVAEAAHRSMMIDV